MPDREIRQSVLTSARRIVVKLGTNAICDESGRPDRRSIGSIARQVAELMGRGVSVTLVSSGAIGSGLGEMGLTERPKAMPELQAAAAIGQAQLMRTYPDALARHGIRVGQVLVTRDDFESRTRYLNIRNTLRALTEWGAVPIINENDTVAVDEIRFGDNDILAALVTNAIPADALVLLSVVDGLHDSDGQVVDLVEDPLAMRMLVTGEKSALGSGGMETKLEAARRVTDAGEIAVIANGRTPDVLTKLTAGERVGTVFVPAHRKLASRERWIGMAVRPGGVLVVDEGAANALRVRGKSLLATGITEITGNFDKGEVVIIRDQRGREVGRGLINYAAEEVRTIQGRRSSEFEKLLGRRAYDEVVHRDNLVVSERRDEAGDEKDAPR